MCHLVRILIIVHKIVAGMVYDLCTEIWKYLTQYDS